MCKKHKLYGLTHFPFSFYLIMPSWLLLAFALRTVLIDTIILIIATFIICKKIDFKVLFKNITWSFLSGIAGLIGGFVLLQILGVIPLELQFSCSNEALRKIFEDINLVVNHCDQSNLSGYIFILFIIILTAVGIFFFNYFLTFRKSFLTKKQKVILSLVIAVFTAPYAFLIQAKECLFCAGIL